VAKTKATKKSGPLSEPYKPTVTPPPARPAGKGKPNGIAGIKRKTRAT
jgi:hypothetical protein